MVGLDRSRYMTVLYNEWGTQTWLLIHSNESCSQGAYTKKSLSYFRTYVSFSGWAQLREIMSWDSFWWILNMLDLKVEIASHLSITLWCTFWWVEPYTNIWINFTLLSLLWHILGKSWHNMTLQVGIMVRSIYLQSFHYCWCAEQPSWILRSGLVRFFCLSELEIRLRGVIPVEISNWELGNDFPVQMEHTIT